MKILFILLVTLVSSGVTGFELCASQKYCVTASIAPTCLEVPHVINKSLSILCLCYCEIYFNSNILNFDYRNLANIYVNLVTFSFLLPITKSSTI